VKRDHKHLTVLAALGIGLVWFIASPLDDIIYAALIAHYARKVDR